MWLVMPSECKTGSSGKLAHVGDTAQNRSARSYGAVASIIPNETLVPRSSNHRLLRVLLTLY